MILILLLLAGCSCGPKDSDSPPADTTPDTDTRDSEPAGDSDDSQPPAPSVDCDSIHQRPKGEEHTFYESNPTYTEPVDDSGWWTYADPEQQGMSAALLQEASDELAALPFVTSFIVLRRGAIVYERYLHGSQAQHSNNVHSASKSILADVAGLALEQGHITGLDQAVAEILPQYFDAVSDPRKLDITVEHLLTMTAGFRWVEDFTEYTIDDQEDWLQAIVDLPLVADPGTGFEYSTGSTHLLSAVITAATGQSTCAYAHEQLLEPMGITAEHWGADPQGIFSGGCNLYRTARELLRLGLLHLQDGVWEGEQLVPDGWIESTEHWHTDFGDGWGYGYCFWLTELDGHPMAIAWGYGGQLVYILRDLDLAVLITTNTRDYSPDYDGTPLVRDYVIPAVTD